jgi:MinD superfamily P-loop ATPase
LSADISNKVMRMPGVQVRVTDLCAGCGTCTEGVCFVEAIHLVDGRASIAETCRGCGRCVEVCPNQAIELTINEDGAVWKTVERLSELVDVA